LINARTPCARRIESYFGAEIEGFNAYRYYKENTTLRGWILLPLAMDHRTQGRHLAP